MNGLLSCSFQKVKTRALFASLTFALNLLASPLPAQTAPAGTAAAPPPDGIKALTVKEPAPVVGAVLPANRITLWNGKDLVGWKIYLDAAASPAPDPAKVWSVDAGVLKLDTKTKGYVMTEKTYSNYHLHVEWRWAKGAAKNSNSGVLVHLKGPDGIWPLCFECQLASGNAGQIVGTGLDIPDAPMLQNRKRAPRLPNVVEKPFGEWNTYEIIAKDDTLDVSINGAPANRVDKLPQKDGAIALQMEGYPVEFQNIWLEPLGESK